MQGDNRAKQYGRWNPKEGRPQDFPPPSVHACIIPGTVKMNFTPMIRLYIIADFKTGRLYW